MATKAETETKKAEGNQMPQEITIKLSEQKISVNLNSEPFRDALQQARKDGYSSGFWDGVKYIVTLAENFLVEHEKLSSREALSRDTTHMPTWWVATLMEALYYEPSYAPMPKRSHEKKETEPGLAEITEAEDEAG